MVNAAKSYLDALAQFVAGLGSSELAMIEPVAERCAQVAALDGTIWTFGSGHGQSLALELHHRAGVPACFVPMVSPMLGFAEGAAVETMAERSPALAAAIAARFAWRPGDVLIAISNSGTTPITVAMAAHARERGLHVVALGSPRCAAPGRPNLFELADHVLDNGAPPGDSVVPLDADTRVGALSSVIGALLLQLVATRTAQLLAERGLVPPVWRSSALAGADAFNDRLAAAWRGRNPGL